MAESLTEGLAKLLARPVAPADRARAALHVLDWVGCAVLGAESEAGRAMAAYGARLGTGPCRAIRAGSRDAAGAAFVNGAYGNVLEMDDIHKTSILHPGPVVVPAALAASEDRDAPAAAFLDAVVRGYEAAIRVGRSVGRAHYRNWHNTSTCGPFGAAAAAGSVLGLDEAEMTAALGNAGTQSAGPWQCRLEGAMSKQLHTARAAASGLAAAELAALGFTGPRLMLEGPLGFYAAMCADPNPDAVLAEPDGAWLIHATSFKPWPACRHGHATIDAALQLYGKAAPGEIEEIVVRSYGDAVAICDCVEPATVLQAKFSLQHTAAIVLLGGPPPLEAFEPSAFPRAAALRRKVRLESAEPYASAYPQRYGAGVTLRLRDGRTLSAEAPDALGDPENPVTPAQVEGKARMLLGAARVAADRIDRLVSSAATLPKGGAVKALTALLP